MGIGASAGTGVTTAGVTGGGAGAAIGVDLGASGAAGSGGAAAASGFEGLGALGPAGIAAAVFAVGLWNMERNKRPFEIAGTGALSASDLSYEREMPNGWITVNPTSASYQKLHFTDDGSYAYQMMADGIPIGVGDAATFMNQYHGPASAVSFHGTGGAVTGAKDYALSEVADILASFTADGYDAATLLWAGATNYGLSEADIRLAGKSRSLPGFYAGGMFEGGLRIVGERGPELEATGPSRIFDAATTASMLRSGGASSDEVVAELRAMRGQLAQLQQEARRTADATNGNPEAPMLTEVVT